jgi:hypothetical protein
MAIQFIDDNGRPIADPGTIARRLRDTHPRCMSPFFGLYVAAAIVAVAAVAWRLEVALQ